MKKGLKMASGLSADLRVKRRVRDGWYVYTCDELPGLFVAGHDDRIAYEDVADSIRAMLRLEHSVDCIVTHKVDLSRIPVGAGNGSAAYLFSREGR